MSKEETAAAKIAALERRVSELELFTGVLMQSIRAPLLTARYERNSGARGCTMRVDKVSTFFQGYTARTGITRAEIEAFISELKKIVHDAELADVNG